MKISNFSFVIDEKKKVHRLLRHTLERYKATLTIPESALKAGNNYTYTVKVRNRGIEVSQATIAAWNEIDLGEVGADL